MSILAMTWAWGLMDLDQSQTLVLLALADAANDEGVCWPSQAEIGRKARLKDRAVRNQIRSLEAAGLLSVSRRATPQGRKTNVYRLNIGYDFSLQSKQPARNAGWVEGSESEPVDNRTFRCNQSNRHEMPVGDPSGTVMPVATGTVMPVAYIHQTP
ncbi:MAG: helix-turn-helix domain-containing protein, partial [Pauljensenia sp.]